MVGVCSLLHVSYLCNNCVSLIQQIFLSTEITTYNIYFPYPSFPISQLNRHPFQISTNTSIQYRTQIRKHFLPCIELTCLLIFEKDGDLHCTTVFCHKNLRKNLWKNLWKNHKFVEIFHKYFTQNYVFLSCPTAKSHLLQRIDHFSLIMASFHLL